MLYILFLPSFGLTLVVPTLELEKMANRFVLSLPCLEQGFVLLEECSLEENKMSCILDGVAQRIEHWPMNQCVTSSIPSQGTCLG